MKKSQSTKNIKINIIVCRRTITDKIIVYLDRKKKMMRMSLLVHCLFVHMIDTHAYPSMPIVVGEYG